VDFAEQGTHDRLRFQRQWVLGEQGPHRRRRGVVQRLPAREREILGVGEQLRSSAPKSGVYCLMVSTAFMMSSKTIRFRAKKSKGIVSP
jgi:hypothetical protein